MPYNKCLKLPTGDQKRKSKTDRHYNGQNGNKDKMTRKAWIYQRGNQNPSIEEYR